MRICDGCSVKEPWEHRCHGINAIVFGHQTGRPCECQVKLCVNVRQKEPMHNAFVDEDGGFHCRCGAEHNRGPVNGFNTWRCLNCGATYKVKGLVELK